MNDSQTIRVASRDGLLGSIENPGPDRDDQDQVQILLDNGQKVWAPRDLLQEQPDGEYYLPLDLAGEREEAGQGSQEVVLPVIQEDLHVEKQRIERAHVRITKRVHEHEETVDEALLQEHVEVRRVPVNRPIESPESPHYEGDTLIIPVMEEVLVVEKRLILVEEIRITKQQEEVRKQQTVPLRSEEVIVERLENQAPADGVPEDSSS